METRPYLIFEQNGFLCGIEACYVREIFFLPELTAIIEAPQDTAVPAVMRYSNNNKQTNFLDVED